MQKILQRTLSSILIFILLCTSFTAYMGGVFLAKAENSLPQSGDYACIPTEGVFFYATLDEKEGLFLLPPTYYVRLLDYTPTYCRVEYQTDGIHTQRLVGYVKTDHLAFVPYTPKHPYLNCMFEVEYKIENASQTANGFLTQIIMTCAYYGDYNVGSATYCYVFREGEFGYIPKPYDLYFDENTEYAEYLETLKPAPEEKTDQPAKRNSPAQIAILIALCLLVPLLAALILKPKSNHEPD